ncbi:unnamed protein product [Clonostachys byssicola]|uniref:1,3-beta-glucanosyltransferase n=1 Tax=Clonostachys byssicola TaxID=160290 RepID=A0A9N9UV75_9HYPO|nr:unnamed protein product [Clonostachys byssicola]
MKSIALLSLGLLASVQANPTRTVQEPPSKRASSLPAISASGRAFWADGKRWYMRGVDYQPGGDAANIDPLADPTVCKRDITEFKDLGINAIRVYAVDNSMDHDECMNALADAGIYVVLDVNNQKYSINRADPHLSYNAAYLQSVFATVEMFAKYDNTAAFFSGNEVINDENGTDASAPYVKAVTRDIRNYISTRGLRKIPVGYSAADVAKNRMQTAHYFNCGSDDMRSDFFAFNDYSWCNSDFKTSGWDIKVKNFTDYGLPIFLSEWGCIENLPRQFEELGALMSDKMTGVYSGGLMYEYTYETNKYGIVDIKDNKVVHRDEFDIFKKKLAKYPMPTTDGGAAKETSSSECPPKDADWDVDSTFIPNMPSQAEKYMKSGAGDGPGLKGKGSQTDGDSGTATASATSGQASPTSSGSSSGSDDKGAAPSTRVPIAVTAAALFGSMVGVFLL